MKDITLKLLSLFLAILIWLYVYGVKKMVFFRDVPIDFLNLPPEKVIIESSAFSVKIKLSASRRILETVKPSIRAEIDLSSVKDGVNIIEITPGNIKAPPYVKILSVSPQTIEIKIDSVTEKSLPVIAEIPVDEDYIVNDLKTIPPEVIVETPKSFTPNENFLVLKIDKKCNKEGNFVYQSPVSLNSENLIHITPKEIKVKWRCDKKMEEKIIKNLPVIIKNKKEGMKYFLKPDKINLKIKGWAKDIKNMNLKDAIEISVDVKDYKKGSYEISPIIKTPDEIEVLAGSEEKLKLRVE